jgi:hypothetical protein
MMSMSRKEAIKAIRKRRLSRMKWLAKKLYDKATAEVLTLQK